MFSKKKKNLGNGAFEGFAGSSWDSDGLKVSLSYTQINRLVGVAVALRGTSHSRTCMLSFEPRTMSFDWSFCPNKFFLRRRFLLNVNAWHVHCFNIPTFTSCIILLKALQRVPVSLAEFLHNYCTANFYFSNYSTTIPNYYGATVHNVHITRHIRRERRFFIRLKSKSKEKTSAISARNLWTLGNSIDSILWPALK